MAMILTLPQENIIKTSQNLKEIDLDWSYTKAQWISESRRYWISRHKYGYVAHMEVLAGNGKWCYIYTYDTNIYVKTLAGAIKRIEKLRLKQG